MEQLDILKIKLEGKNLIEASAGTGKTYSITILILRMIVENTPIDSIRNILVVTYTNAAANELRDRIRIFINKAYIYTQTDECDDSTMKAIVDSAIEEQDRLDIAYKIKRSLSLMDESNIMTIHSFVQKTLNDFPIDTFQSFQTELVPDIDDWIEEQIVSFWRKYITELPSAILQNIGSLEQLKKDAGTALKLNLEEKKLWIPEKLTPYTYRQYQDEHLSEGYFQHLEKRHAQLKNTWEKEKESVIQALAEQNIKGKPENRFRKMADDFETFLSDFITGIKKDTKYITGSSGFFFDDVHSYLEELNLLPQKIIEFKTLLFHQLIIEFTPKILKKIRENNALTFDSMIRALRRRITEEHSDTLSRTLRDKYKAVFIDEFQDTDYDQFIIFKELFFQSALSTMFVIGDPKQSIYGFRNADIDCYLRAKELVDHTYSMTVNYRSSPDMVSAMNDLFSSLDKKEIFGFSQDDDQFIQYEEVSADKMIEFRKNGRREKEALTFHGYNNKNDAIDNLINTVTELLSSDNAYSFYFEDKNSTGNGISRDLKPSDIGILIRSKNDGRTIKRELARLGIPSVQMFDEKILKTPETLQIAFLLEAFMNPHPEVINKAIYFSFLQNIPFYSYKNEDKSLDDNTLIPYFSKYNEYVLKDRVYEALYTFLEDFGVRRYFSLNEKYAHIISHIEQLIQLINTYQYRKSASTDEIISWLKDNYFGVINDGDEYIAIIESDESAVKIVTIHKSKGLEYPVTLILGIDKKSTVRDDSIIFFKFPGSDDIYYTHEQLADEGIYENVLLKQEQENRRLLYVALTRSVFRCYHFFSTYSKDFEGSGLQIILNEFDKTDTEYSRMYLRTPVAQHPVAVSQDSRSIHEAVFAPERMTGFQSHQVMLSYSALSRHHETYIPAETTDAAGQENDDYDEFIFKILPRGAYIGTLVHELFQQVSTDDFIHLHSNESSKRWRYQPSVKNMEYILKDRYKDSLIETFLYNVFNAHLTDAHHQDTIRLSHISAGRILHELEFNFSLNISNTRLISDHLLQFDALADFNEEKLKGLMNGYIDLIFEHNGRYYILDWKTNHLGNHLSHYASEHLYGVMTMNNYHLQYYIYTAALHLYLSERMRGYDYEKHFGGVFYLFVRGCRAEQNTGVFYNRPSKDTTISILDLFNTGSLIE